MKDRPIIHISIKIHELLEDLKKNRRGNRVTDNAPKQQEKK